MFRFRISSVFSWGGCSGDRSTASSPLFLHPSAEVARSLAAQNPTHALEDASVKLVVRWFLILNAQHTRGADPPGGLSWRNRQHKILREFKYYNMWL